MARLVVDAALVFFLSGGLLAGALLGEKAAKLTREHRQEATAIVQKLAREQPAARSVAGSSQIRSNQDQRLPSEDWSSPTADERTWTSALRKVESLDVRGSRHASVAHLPPSA